MSLCSSPVQDMSGRRSPLKRRMSESLDYALNGSSYVKRKQRWNSDSAIYRCQSDEFPSPKVRRLSAFTCTGRGLARLEDGGRSARMNKPQGYRRRQEVGQRVVTGDLMMTSDEQGVPCSADDGLSVFVGEDDALVPSCDSLNSSMRDVMTPDSSQVRGIPRSSTLTLLYFLCSSIKIPHSLIHSAYFYNAASSPLLLRGALDTAWILCRSFMPKRHRLSQSFVSEGLAKGP